MRIVKVGVLAPTNKGIPLGVQGENRATQVEFDTRPWFREYPSGTVSAVARRYGDPAPYPLSLDVDDGIAVWQVSDTDTAKAGEGAVELTMTSAGARVRSLTFKTLVTASLTDAPVDDDAWYGWLDNAVVKVDETVQAAQRKMAEVDEEWTGLKSDVTAKVDECGKAAAQAAEDAHHAKVDAQATAKALESAEGSVAKAEAAAKRAVDAMLDADDSAVEASRSALSAGDSAEAARLSADAAANSAGDAASSASDAATAASSAAGSASAAEQSATDASNAKVAAQTAKAEAATSASNAATSESNAASSATAAAKSASDAAASVNAINVIAPKTVETAASSVPTSIAIGNGVTANFVNSVNVGGISKGSYSTVVGIGAEVPEGSNASVAIGYQSIAYGINQFAVGGPERQREIVCVKDPTNKTSAATKKYTDANDTKTLTEAKKYTDENTSNALVGNVSGKLLHVEDAWPSPVREFVVYGKTVQAEGTPTPENPLPLRSAEPTGVVSCGKNLFDVSEEALTEKYLKGFYTINDGAISFNTANEWGGDHLYFNRVAVGGDKFTFSMKWSGDTGEVNTGAKLLLRLYSYTGDMITLPKDEVFGYGSSNFMNYNTVYKGYPQPRGYTSPISFDFLESAGVAYAVLGVCASSNTAGVPINIWDVQLEVSDSATPYSPYDGASAAIPEGLVLRSLPNGTSDEYDPSTGTVTRRVGVVDSTSEWGWGNSTDKMGYIHYTINSIGFLEGARERCYSNIPIGITLFNKSVNTEFASSNVLAFFRFKLTDATDLASAIAYMRSLNAVLYYQLGTPIVEHVAPITIHDMRGPVGNVWAESVSVSTSIKTEYKRDINIAFDKLTQAVVAAAAGE